MREEGKKQSYKMSWVRVRNYLIIAHQEYKIIKLSLECEHHEGILSCFVHHMSDLWKALIKYLLDE